MVSDWPAFRDCPVGDDRVMVRVLLPEQPTKKQTCALNKISANAFNVFNPFLEPSTGYLKCVTPLERKQGLQVNPACGRTERVRTLGQCIRFPELRRIQGADRRREIDAVEKISRRHAESEVVAAISCGASAKTTASAAAGTGQTSAAQAAPTRPSTSTATAASPSILRCS